jgi:hypothetical protein
MISRHALALGTAVAFALGAAAIGAQQEAGAAPGAGGRPKAAQAIEIRGQVPTPQVVTVRPRQIPMFSREVLTPAFFDRHFWESLVAPYEIVPDLSAAAGATPVSLAPPALPADSSHRPPPADTSGHVTGSAGLPPPNSGPSLRASAGDAAQSPTPNAPREK